MASAPVKLIVDETHMGRRASGIERITSALFSPSAFPELDVTSVRSSGGRLSMLVAQSLRIPALTRRDASAIWVFPGYPPSPLVSAFSQRAVMYVHDLFLKTRPEDLNLAGKIYMAPSFQYALRRLKTFLVNSSFTASELRNHVATDAEILLYRPVINNVFKLDPPLIVNASKDRPLVLGAIGTIEPRKNFGAAVRIRAILQEKLGRPVHLRIIGRPGWGVDVEKLTTDKNVELLGFLDDDRMRTAIETFDLFICTSHAEGLGLPLLEVQHAGLPVVAPDQPVFREVLSSSGIFIDPSNPAAAAQTILETLDRQSLQTLRAQASTNIRQWNETARGDREVVLERFRMLSRQAV